ncbi:hypothetical protein [Tabrizicola caldifontis]|uniref:hypothetical protein n=1 Tax=Tabrizicola caldifontis TaxID=2528036 RepID=UPI001081A751|nr:hypothetical protein [Rhodobacter sp. YIM 73028]
MSVIAFAAIAPTAWSSARRIRQAGSTSSAFAIEGTGSRGTLFRPFFRKVTMFAFGKLASLAIAARVFLCARLQIRSAQSLPALSVRVTVGVCPDAPKPAAVAGEGRGRVANSLGHGAAPFLAEAIPAAVAMKVTVHAAALCCPGEVGDLVLLHGVLHLDPLTGVQGVSLNAGPHHAHAAVIDDPHRQWLKCADQLGASARDARRPLASLSKAVRQAIVVGSEQLRPD